jgi:S-adenosylmethionine decarboxylase
MKSLGNHLLVEMYDCDTAIINNHEMVEAILVEAAKAAGANVVNQVFHKFNPHGVSGVVVISESHLSIHTWPEFGYCAIDVFTCGDTINNMKAVNHMKQMFRSKSVSVMEMKRGVLNLSVAQARRHKSEVRV